MKMRNKGKVHPSSSSTSSTPSPFPATGDSLSVLNLLPTAILSLAVVLSVEDREVLAYMITRSIKSPNPRVSKQNVHKSPVFDCGCFDCYTSYWFRWDTSPNRELIHQAIEAFEENLTSNENLKKKGKKREKMTHRRFAGKVIDPPEQYDAVTAHRMLAGKVIEVTEQNDVISGNSSEVTEQNDVITRKLAGKRSEVTERNDVIVNRMLAGKSSEATEENDVVALVDVEAGECTAEESPVVTAVLSQQNRGLGRKGLADVTGILNWRLWSIWGPK